MTRLFHVLAAALILAAIGLSVARPSLSTPMTDPQRLLIDFMAESDVVYLTEQSIPGTGLLLSFKTAGCASNMAIVYFPSLSRIPSALIAAIKASNAAATFVYDGEIIGGLGMLDLMPRWAWRKLAVALDVQASEPWQSIALAMLVPRDCATPRIDWMMLRTRN